MSFREFFPQHEMNQELSGDFFADLLRRKRGQFEPWIRRLGSVEEVQIEAARANAAESSVRGAYYERQGDPNRFRRDARTGAVLDSQTGQIVQPPKSVAETISEREEIARERGWDLVLVFHSARERNPTIGKIN